MVRFYFSPISLPLVPYLYSWEMFKRHGSSTWAGPWWSQRPKWSRFDLQIFSFPPSPPYPHLPPLSWKKIFNYLPIHPIYSLLFFFPLCSHLVSWQADIFPTMVHDRGWPTSSEKGQIINSWAFEGHLCHNYSTFIIVRKHPLAILEKWRGWSSIKCYCGCEDLNLIYFSHVTK